MSISKLYDIVDAAHLIGFTEGTLRQYVSQGLIECVHIGRLVRIPESVIARICRYGLDTSPSALKQNIKPRIYKDDDGQWWVVKRVIDTNHWQRRSYSSWKEAVNTARDAVA